MISVHLRWPSWWLGVELKKTWAHVESPLCLCLIGPKRRFVFHPSNASNSLAFEQVFGLHVERMQFPVSKLLHNTRGAHRHRKTSPEKDRLSAIENALWCLNFPSTLEESWDHRSIGIADAIAVSGSFVGCRKNLVGLSSTSASSFLAAA